MDEYYILIAEGGGFPSHAIGPFDTYDEACKYQASSKWLISWGGIHYKEDLRDLPVFPPE